MWLNERQQFEFGYQFIVKIDYELIKIYNFFFFHFR